MSNNKIKIAGIFLVVITVTMIVVFNNIKSNKENNNNKKTEINIEEVNVDNRQLTISHDKCVGCGKCANIDSEHFSMAQQTKKAIVISNKNLDSDNLKMAISYCPTIAIELK